MTHEDDQTTSELAAFCDFVRLSGRSVVSGSVEKRDPPAPDIYCEIEDEGPVAFELMELADPNIAKGVAHVGKHPEDSGRTYIRGGDSMQALEAKLRKRYETSCPVDLLCYVDGLTGLPPDVLVPLISERVESTQHRYRNVWFLSAIRGEECCQRIGG